ncbi:unnamed protein product [Clavelina lepadiformis]|uniref:Caspase recruitment domain-containing protein n=1 Tax=Clavelina lepadiformis TaxID=159417 RepID=A0ABP0G4Q1_CLALP
MGTSVRGRRLDILVKEKVTRNLFIKKRLFDIMKAKELLEFMPCVYLGTKQEIVQSERNDGQRSAAGMFLDKVPTYGNWAEQFLAALCETGHEDVVRQFFPEYFPPLPACDNNHDSPPDDDDQHPSAPDFPELSSHPGRNEENSCSLPSPDAPPSYEESTRGEIPRCNEVDEEDRRPDGSSINESDETRPKMPVYSEQEPRCQVRMSSADDSDLTMTEVSRSTNNSDVPTDSSAGTYSSRTTSNTDPEISDPNYIDEALAHTLSSVNQLNNPARENQAENSRFENLHSPNERRQMEYLGSPASSKLGSAQSCGSLPSKMYNTQDISGSSVAKVPVTKSCASDTDVSTSCNLHSVAMEIESESLHGNTHISEPVFSEFKKPQQQQQTDSEENETTYQPSSLTSGSIYDSSLSSSNTPPESHPHSSAAQNRQEVVSSIESSLVKVNPPPLIDEKSDEEEDGFSSSESAENEVDTDSCLPSSNPVPDRSKESIEDGVLSLSNTTQILSEESAGVTTEDLHRKRDQPQAVDDELLPASPDTSPITNITLKLQQGFRWLQNWGRIETPV